MRPSDKSVLLISNDLSDENNTLTSFSGSIPSDFLNKHKSWKVAVHSCGLHFMLKQPISSKYKNHPSLIQITMENFNKAAEKNDSGMNKCYLWMFENSLKLFVDREKSYTLKSLAEDFEQQAASHRTGHEKYDGIPFNYDQQSEIMKFGQFESDGKDSNERISKLPKGEKMKSRTFVFINGRFKEGLRIQFSRINKTDRRDFLITEIGGELY